jgi:hypothetical protein
MLNYLEGHGTYGERHHGHKACISFSLQLLFKKLFGVISISQIVPLMCMEMHVGFHVKYPLLLSHASKIGMCKQI